MDAGEGDWRGAASHGGYYGEGYTSVPLVDGSHAVR
jgi:hypothetical protein